MATKKHTDFDVITRRFDGTDDIRVYPISDVHLGSREHKVKEWRDFIRMITADPQAYVIILGDLCDTALKNSKSDIYQASMTIMDQLQAAVDQLKPLADAGKILAITGGNHEARISKEVGLDASYIIAERLGIADLYRPHICFVKLVLHNEATNNRYSPCYVMAATHGSGGGGTYSFLNKNNQFAMTIDGIDALITGHTHKPAVITPAKMRVDVHKDTVTVQPYYCITATAWLEYNNSYGLGMMLAPGSTRPQVINLSGHTKNLTVTM